MPERPIPSRMVGILGGMGPAATADFYLKLISATPATRDQDHLRVAIWADPTVPDRSRALLAGGEDPTPWLKRGVRHLVASGAEILVVPCNTIHSYLPAVVKDEEIEFLSIIDTTVEATLNAHAAGKVGLLATDGAIGSRIFQSALSEAGLETIVPAEPSQRVLMQIIYSVKDGTTGPEERNQLLSILDGLRASGVSTVIAGCTEISVMLNQLDVDIPVIDPSQALAVRTVERARSVE